MSVEKDYVVPKTLPDTKSKSEAIHVSDKHKYASPEHHHYAQVLGAGVKIGFVLLVVSFALYVTGVLPPLVPLDQVPHYWGMSAADYVKATGTPTGWGWLTKVNKGDMLNYVGIAVLAGAAIFSTFALLPHFKRQGERAHLIIAVLLISVLVASAANLLH